MFTVKINITIDNIMKDKKLENKDYFDEEFQYEAVKALLEQNGLFGKMYSILEQNAFKDNALRAIVAFSKDYYKKNGFPPDYVAIKAGLKGKAGLDTTDLCSSIARLKCASTEGQDVIVENLYKFFKLKAITALINKGMEMINGNEDDDKIISKFTKEIEKISAIGKDTGIITYFNEDTIINACMKGDNEVVPTGIKELDECLCGGLGRGEIGLFAAPTGYGKTTAATIFAHNASKLGYNVVQIFFEDKPEDIVRKHLAITMDTNSNTFRRMDEDEAGRIAKDAMTRDGSVAVNEHLRIVRMADGNTTVEDIDNLSRSLSNNGFMPDMVLIDYFSSLKHSANPTKDKLEAQARCMRKIVDTIAYKYNCAVWVMQQTNRGAVSKEADNTMASWQGSYEATQPASVWLMLQRTKEQKANFKADLIFHKTRHSQPKNDLYDIVFDNARLRMDCSGAMDSDDELEWKDDVIKNNGNFIGTI